MEENSLKEVLLKRCIHKTATGSSSPDNTQFDGVAGRGVAMRGAVALARMNSSDSYFSPRGTTFNRLAVD